MTLTAEQERRVRKASGRPCAVCGARSSVHIVTNAKPIVSLCGDCGDKWDASSDRTLWRHEFNSNKRMRIVTRFVERLRHLHRASQRGGGEGK